MVELQSHAEAFARDGVALYALSYDEPDALADYADEFGVAFPLLSDPESEIIERFGILNDLIAADDHPWYGIPFPGSYVINADGVITAKFFEENLSIRANADDLRRAAIGEEVLIAPATERPVEVTMDVAFDGDVISVGVMRDLVITLRVPDGQHLYGEPVPDGMVATSVEIDESVGLIVRDAKLPPTHTHVLNGTGEELQVFDGDVIIRIPISQNSRGLEERDDGSQVQRVTGTVRWQSCDDDVCHLPTTRVFELEIPATGANWASFKPKEEGAPGMDALSHFMKMNSRRE